MTWVVNAVSRLQNEQNRANFFQGGSYRNDDCGSSVIVDTLVTLQVEKNPTNPKNRRKHEDVTDRNSLRCAGLDPAEFALLLKSLVRARVEGRPREEPAQPKNATSW